MPIKIVYFNLGGLAELSRLIAAYGKIEFEDSRVEFSEWPALKASKLNLTFKVVPLMTQITEHIMYSFYTQRL